MGVPGGWRRPCTPGRPHWLRGLQWLTDMATLDVRDQLGESADDLTVARRAHVKALERLAQLRLEMRGPLRAVRLARRALGSKADRAYRLEKALRKAQRTLESAACESARIDEQTVFVPPVGAGTLRFVGMWRPPTPPASPQELDCSAVICNCLEYLRTAGQMRQHWETGCFDRPEYEVQEAIGFYYLFDEPEAEETEPQE